MELALTHRAVVSLLAVLVACAEAPGAVDGPKLPHGPSLACNGYSCCAVEGSGVVCWGETPDGERGPPRWVPELDGTKEIRAAGAYDDAYVGRRAGGVWVWDRGPGARPEIRASDVLPQAPAAVTTIELDDGSALCVLASDRVTLECAEQPIITFPRPVARLAGSCALLEDGSLWCASGAPGKSARSGKTALRRVATEVRDFTSEVLLVGDTVRAWSATEGGELEVVPPEPDRAERLPACAGALSPLACAVLPLRPDRARSVREVARSHGSHHCVRWDDRSVACWGDDEHGETAADWISGLRELLDADVVDFWGSPRLALRADGRIERFPDAADSVLPPSPNPPRGAARLAVRMRDREMAVLTRAGEVWALARGWDSRESWERLPIAGRVTQVATGEGGSDRLCALTTEGSVSCTRPERRWDRPSHEIASVPELAGAREIFFAEENRLCARTDRELRCEGTAPIPLAPDDAVIGALNGLCIVDARHRWRCRGAGPFGATPSERRLAELTPIAGLGGMTHGTWDGDAACFWNADTGWCTGMDARLVPGEVRHLGPVLPIQPAPIAGAERVFLGPMTCVLRAGRVACFGEDAFAARVVASPRTVDMPPREAMTE